MTDAERMRGLLRYANYAKVGKALGVSRASVAEWAKGNDVSPYRLHQVESLLTPETQESAPAWAEALADETVKKVIEAVTTPERLQQIETLIARLEELAPPPGEASGDPSAEQDPVEPERPGRATG